MPVVPPPAQAAAMPDVSVSDIAFLERLPKWLICVPLVAQWLILGLRHRSFTLPALANPHITSGGLVGEGKHEYFRDMGPQARAATAPWALLDVPLAPARRLTAATAVLARHGLGYPLIAKPDIGWCGFGVCRVDDDTALQNYLLAFPAGERLMLQAYVDWPGEAGVFYQRQPGAMRGRISGLALRHYPQVEGDGRRSVAELIAADPRLARLQRDALHRLDAGVAARLHTILDAGTTLRLSTIGSTRVGGRYENGAALITPALEARIDAIARDLPAFHFGRFDLRYASREALARGEDFRIIEINGAGSEAIEAWDPAQSPRQAFATILRKQARLFDIAAAQRRRSAARPLSALALLRLHLRQQALIRRYPPSN